MLWKHAALGDERGFMTIKNVEASSLTTGYLVALRVGTGASFNGTNAVRAAAAGTADLPAFIGVAVQDIASNNYGLVQTYGPTASVAISNVGTSITINVGDPIVPGGAAGTGFSLAPTYAASGFKYILASATNPAISAFGYISGWIRGVL